MIIKIYEEFDDKKLSEICKNMVITILNNYNCIFTHMLQTNISNI